MASDVTAVLMIVALVCLTSLHAQGLQVSQASQSELLSRFTSSVNPSLLRTRALLYGPAESFGLFEHGGGFGIEAGVVISTGRVVEMLSSKPSHDYPDVTWGLRESGDAAAFAILITPVIPATVMFDYVFASLELPVYGGKSYNDLFELRVNGENRALLSNDRLCDGRKCRVTINNLCPSHDEPSTWHPDYIDNPNQLHFGFSGHTKLQRLTGVMSPHIENVVNISIQDVGDGEYDSAVFLKQDSFKVIIQYSYQPSEWSACSASCGNGVRTRDVACLGSDGGVAPSSASCAGPFRPATDEQCFEQSCIASTVQPTVRPSLRFDSGPFTTPTKDCISGHNSSGCFIQHRATGQCIVATALPGHLGKPHNRADIRIHGCESPLQGRVVFRRWLYDVQQKQLLLANAPTMCLAVADAMLNFFDSDETVSNVRGDDVHLWTCDDADVETVQWSFDALEGQLSLVAGAGRCLARVGSCQHCRAIIENELVMKRCAVQQQEDGFDWLPQLTSKLMSCSARGTGITFAFLAALATMLI